MTEQEFAKIKAYVLDQGLVDASIFELTDEDRADGVKTEADKFYLETSAEDRDNYISFSVNTGTVLLFKTPQGVAEYAQDQLRNLDDQEDLIKLLGQFTDYYRDLLDYWGVKFVDEGDSIAIAPKNEYIKTY